MSIILAFDIGTHRTGVAMGDDRSGFVVALDTIVHANETALLRAIISMVRSRRAAEIVVGFPLLPQGREGSRAKAVRRIVDNLKGHLALPVTLLDERYTSTASSRAEDPDARAACMLLSVLIDQRHKG